MKAFRTLLIFIFPIFFIFLLGYIDVEIITPLLPLPEDTGFYHTDTLPAGIRLFYLHSSGQFIPPFTGLNLMVPYMASVICGIFTTNQLLNVWKKKKRTINSINN